MMFTTAETGRRWIQVTSILAAVLGVIVFGANSVQAQWTTDSNNNIYYNSGTVAIGATPSGNFKFEVVGYGTVGTGAKISVISIARSGGDYDSVGYNFRPTSTSGLYQYDLGDTSSRLEFTAGGFKFKTAPSGSAGNTITYSDAMTILQGGNVGIGTTNPGYKLNIENTDSGTGVGLNPVLTLTNQQYTVNTGASLGFEFAAGTLGAAITGLSAQSNGGGSLAFSTRTNSGTLGERLRIDSNGGVGIGTIPSGSYKFEVAGQGTAGTGAKIGIIGIARSGADYDSIGYNFRPTSSSGVYNYELADTSSRLEFTSGGFRFKTAPSGSGGSAITYADAFTILQGGNVGIGTTTPGYKLDVNGNTNVSGNITASGSIAAKYQDVAEWVSSSEQLAAGTVVVLDSTKSNQVTSSSISYDTRVAGVISAQPGITLGEKSDGKVLVATTGRVKIKVDASKSSIQIGDLLVTSDIPGVAMKSQAVNLGGVQFHRPGTLIGKALEPLEKGKGEILVLLSLQ